MLKKIVDQNYRYHINHRDYIFVYIQLKKYILMSDTIFSQYVLVDFERGLCLSTYLYNKFVFFLKFLALRVNLMHVRLVLRYNNIPSEEYRNNPCTILRNLQERRLRQIEVFTRRIAPATIVTRQSRVRRAEVGGGDGDNSRPTPFRVVIAP